MTEENTENQEKKKEGITFRLVNDEEKEPKKVVLVIEGFNIEYPFEFQTEEDAKVAMKFGGTLFDCFKGMIKLGANIEDADTMEENTSSSLSAS